MEDCNVRVGDREQYEVTEWRVVMWTVALSSGQPVRGDPPPCDLEQLPSTPYIKN
jgi:hypothetical protein